METLKINRTKVGQGYFQLGYRRGFKKNPIIYLIDGKYYAKDTKNAASQYDAPDFDGYVRVNKHSEFFHQCYASDHISI